MVLRRLPDFLTFLRLLASPWLAWLLLHSRFRTALLVVLFAGLTDWFDGFAARRLGVSGKFGVILDPIADKTLLLTLFLILGVINLLPLWLVVLVIARDLTILTGALLLRRFRHIRQFLPSTLGKVSTFFQIVLVFLVLVYAAFPNQFYFWLRNIAFVLGTVFTAASGADYVRRGVQMARQRPVSPG